MAAGFDILILSDRGVGPQLAPIPSLLATAGVHHHLVREGTRTRCALVVESGDAREVHHVSLLLGYGAGVVNPYVAFETIDDMIRARDAAAASIATRRSQHYIKALNKGVLKVMSKMGISTLQSYCGAQIFEAIGLSQAFIDKYFTHTTSRIGGVGIDVDRRGSADAPRSARSAVSRSGRRSSRRAASISGGATASITCSTRTRCSSCSTRRAAGSTRSSRSTRAPSTSRTSIARRCAGCSA